MRKKISFKGVFHNLPYGMQSHIYAPMGVDLRNKYRIGGNQPGEPREARELGVDTPVDGLYLREDVEIVCNVALASYVKKESKEAIGKMIDRLVRKAELLDEGKLHAMFENGRLKTSKPTYSEPGSSSIGASSAPSSPSPSTMSGFQQPALMEKAGFGNYHDVVRRDSQHRISQYVPQYQQQGYNGPEQARPGADRTNMPMINELPADMYHPQTSPSLYPAPLKSQGASFRSELPGDTNFIAPTPSPQPSPRVQSTPPNSEASMQQQYQAYIPPSQQHPAERNSYGSSSTNQDAPPQGPLGLSNNVASWQRDMANAASQPSTNGTRVYSYPQQTRPSQPPEPDHQRFSNLSVQSPPMPARNPNRLSMQPQQRSTSPNAKCPVCDLFEGDAAAVSHHVSKAHFS